MGSITVRRARSRRELETAGRLLLAYGAETGIDPERHGLTAELADLPAAFAPPGGTLLLATVDGEVAGCVVVRPLPDGAPGVAEIKRLYVTREHRGHGVGRRLLGSAVTGARRLGYVSIRLDSLPTMVEAIALYRRAGFREVAPHRQPIEPGTLFMELSLAPTKPPATWRRGGFEISTDPRRLDLDVVHGFLRTAYWCEGVPRDVVERAVKGSRCFGLYQDGRQVGFARVVTDRATFAYLADVFVLPEHRGQALGKWLVSVVLAHPHLQGLRRFLLATKDAHGLYAQHGFTPLGNPSRFMERHAPDAYGRADPVA